MTIVRYAGNGDLLFVIAHASTEVKYDTRNTLVRFLLKEYGDVLVFDLPGHGDAALSEKKILSSEEMIMEFSMTLDSIERPFFFIGYSLGALLGNKYFCRSGNDGYRAMMIGAGLKVHSSSMERIRDFFDPRNYQAPNIRKIMRERHGPFWESLIQTLQFNLTDPSALLPSEKELEIILKSPIDFLIAEKDQAYQANDLIELLDPDRVYIVPGGHFTYFHQKIAWKNTIEALQDSIRKFQADLNTNE